MCIRVKNIFPKKAKADIVCYKILNKDMTAPYTGFQYDFREYKANSLFSLLIDIKDSIIRKVREGFPICYWYSIGLIHTYKNPPLMFWSETFNHLDRRLFKCIIPKGTYYYKSDDSFEFEYASRRLKIIKEVSYAEFK